MFLLKLAKITSEDEIRFLDVQEELKKRIETSINSFAEKHNINSGTLSAMIKGKRAIPLNLISRNAITEETRWLLKNTNIPIKLPKRLTPELGYLLGALRDGTISNEFPGEWTCSFYSLNKEHVEKLRNLANEMFGVEQRIESFGDVFGIRIRSKTLFLFFTLLFEAKSRQKDWNTPKLIANASRKVKLNYVMGFFDAEGGIPHLENMKNPKRKNLYIKFVQKNKESLEFIKETLKREGIQMGKVYFSDDKYVVKVNKQSISLFSKKVKPLHPEKAKRLQMLTRLLA